MERKYIAFCIAVIIGLAVTLAARSMYNPMEVRRETLIAQLEQIKPSEAELEGPQASYERWKKSIEAKPAVWQELIPAPPPPPPPPEKPPNTKEKVANLKVTRQGVGQKVRIMTPEDAKGKFLGPGDTINGMKIKEVTKTTVTFVLEWKGQELTEVVLRQ